MSIRSIEGVRFSFRVKCSYSTTAEHPEPFG
jgi:hypothetical protein